MLPRAGSLRRLAFGLAALVALAPCLAIVQAPDIGPAAALLLPSLAVVSVLSPASALLLLAGLLPLTTMIALLPGIGLRGTGLAEAMVLVAIVGWLLRHVWNGGDDAGIDPRLAAPAAVFGLLAVASAAALLPDLALRYGGDEPISATLWQFVTADFFGGSARFGMVVDAVVVLECLALLLVAQSECSANPVLAPRVARMMVAGATAAALLNVYRLVAAALSAGAGWRGLEGLAVMGRISMHFDRNAAGLYFAMLLLVSAAFWNERNGRTAARSASLALVAALWLTGSRAALGAATVSGLVMAIVMARRGLEPRARRAALVAAGGLLAAGLSIAVLYPFNRNPDLRASVNGRTELAVAALHMIAAHPWAGVGIGRFYDLSPEYGRPALFDVLPPDNPHENAHNNFLQIGAELGIPGLVTLLWLLGALTARVWRAPRLSRFGVAISCALLAYILTWLTGHPLLVPEAAFPFFLLAGLTGSFPAPPPARSARPLSVLAAVACLLIAATLPWRLSTAARGAYLEHVGYGVGAWRMDPEVGRFRSADADASLFAPAGSVIQLPLRRAPGAGAIVVGVSLDGKPADRISLEDERWHVLRLVIPSSAARFRRLDLHVEPARIASPLLAGDVRVVGER